MHGAALADEARPEFLENAVGLNEDAPETGSVFAVVCTVDLVLIEPDRVRDFIGLFVYINVEAEFGQLIHHETIKSSDRPGLERDLCSATVTRLNRQTVSNEIKQDLERALAVRDGRSIESATGDVEG